MLNPSKFSVGQYVGVGEVVVTLWWVIGTGTGWGADSILGLGWVLTPCEFPLMEGNKFGVNIPHHVAHSGPRCVPTPGVRTVFENSSVGPRCIPTTGVHPFSKSCLVFNSTPVSTPVLQSNPMMRSAPRWRYDM